MDANVDTISREVYVHSTTNQPTPEGSVDAEITVLNSKHIELTNWAKAPQQTQYTLHVYDPKVLGLTSLGQNTVNRFVDDLLLCFNLSLRDGTFLIYPTHMLQPRIQMKKLEAAPPTVEKNGNLTKISFQETVVVTDSIHITMGFREQLDENSVIDTLHQILKLDASATSQIKIQDLKKSLEEYKMAMSNFNRLGIFKHLFNAIELATNCDGKNRESSNLDVEVSSLISISASDIEDWRKFYARTKHIDVDSSHEARYVQGMNEMPSKIRTVRDASRKIIMKRLSHFR